MDNLTVTYEIIYGIANMTVHGMTLSVTYALHIVHSLKLLVWCTICTKATSIVHTYALKLLE